ncbi:MAG: hypothetical protein ACLR60_12285 [Clostridium paraputrificum]
MNRFRLVVQETRTIETVLEVETEKCMKEVDDIINVSEGIGKDYQTLMNDLTNNEIYLASMEPLDDTKEIRISELEDVE